MAKKSYFRGKQDTINVRMKKLGVLLTHEYKLLSVAAILEVFNTANILLKGQGCTPAFDIELLTQNPTNETEFGFKLNGLSITKTYDLILIPAFSSANLPQALIKNSTYVEFIINQFKQDAEIATFCTGAFLLGTSGLLNGKIATTHVDAKENFEMAFPKVKLRCDKTVTQDGRLYTSGGATSSFHLLLHLINQACGQEMAIRIAKVFAIDMGRETQTYFSTFQPPKSHHDELVAIAQQKIEEQYCSATTIEEIIKDLPTSRRNMVRRFKQVTGKTPIEYLQLTRIEAAKRLLETTQQQMNEIIFSSGYSDPKAFRKIFKKSVGMTPSQYREKFQAT